MTIYVDDTFEWDAKDWRRGQWCHMWTDEDESTLHQFARKIGLKQSWFQDSNSRFHHYDLRPSKREAALNAGAQYKPLRDWIKQHYVLPKEETTDVT